MIRSDPFCELELAAPSLLQDQPRRDLPRLALAQAVKQLAPRAQRAQREARERRERATRTDEARVEYRLD